MFANLSSRYCILFAALLLLAPIAAGAGDKRPITEKDLFDFVWVGDPQISPDGSRVAFVRVSVNEKKLGYDTAIWIVPTAGNDQPHRLTNGTHDSSPRWSPDGRFLMFARATEKDGKPEPAQLAMLPMNGGDAWTFTDLPKGAGSPRWSPDGKTIAFTSTSNPEDLAKQQKKKEAEEAAKKAAAAVSPAPNASASAAAAVSPGPKTAEAPDEHESDVLIVTHAIYRENDEGNIDFKRPEHIWTIPAPKSADEKLQPKQITSGRFDESNPMWSIDGAQLYFTSDRVDEPYYDLPRTEIYSVPAHGGEPAKLASIDMGVNALSLSPDGKQFALIASQNHPVNSYTQPDLWVMDVAKDAKPRNLTQQFDYDVGEGVFGDQETPRAGGSNRPIWSADGKSILEIFGKEGRTNLGRFDATSGAVTEVTKGDQAVLSFRATPDESKIVCLISTPTRLGDLFLIGANGEQKQLTDLNHHLWSQLTLSEPEEISYKSFDGKTIQAWIQKPANFDPHKKYPLILNIHGGPHAAYGYIFEHEFQWMAAKGYVVLYPNPRGSTTYGQEFGNVIQYHYPGDDYQDLMRGVDEVLKHGYIDDHKLGVTGGSGGGLLTNWVVTHTQRFAAGVAQRDIASWEHWWYTADFTLFQPTWFKGPPFDDRAEFEARSPITYIKNVKTPMMFVLGDDDTRTPPGAGGEEMFRALKFLRVPAVMVKFPGENHELSRSGQPWHRVERLEHIVGWFNKWLMGATKPEYDVAPEVSAKGSTPPAQSTRP
ncbi:MAG: S9 family peptidase [Verrucomicrobia bacterium]|nr:S9 family peptidase [Verrucomicrobiota bacterium]